MAPAAACGSSRGSSQSVGIDAFRARRQNFTLSARSISAVDGNICHGFTLLIALNLHVSKQAPHLMQMSWTILCGFFFSPMMAPAGQTRVQAVQPLQNCSVILYDRRSLQTPAGQRFEDVRLYSSGNS
jgi:hypothetical protein